MEHVILALLRKCVTTNSRVFMVYNIQTRQTKQPLARQHISQEAINSFIHSPTYPFISPGSRQSLTRGVCPSFMSLLTPQCLRPCRLMPVLLFMGYIFLSKQATLTSKMHYYHFVLLCFLHSILFILFVIQFYYNFAMFSLC